MYLLMKTDLYFQFASSQLTLSGRFLNCSLELASVPVVQTPHNLLVVQFPLSGKRKVMSGVAEKRIMEERKQWRIDHPPGFFAKFSKNKDDSQNMMVWETGIPGREGTDWEGAVFNLTIRFSKEFPLKPPQCKFTPPIWHPNVYSDGSICLSILNEDGWSPGTNVKQILLGIQELFTDPNPRSPANPDSGHMFMKKRAEYDRRIRAQTAQFTPST